MERRSCLFTLVAVAVGITITVVTIFIYLKLRGDCDISETTCLTPECVQVTAQILSYLDATVNPCDNFYVFACGNFVSTTEIPENKKSVSTLSTIHDELQRQLRELLEQPIQPDEWKYIKTLKNYYQACNNVAAVEQRGIDLVKRILIEIGGWPVLEGSGWKANEFNWYHYAYKLKEYGLDTDFFISLYISNDVENPERRVINIDLPKLSLSPSFMTQNSNNEYVRIYYHYMVSVAKKMGANETRAVGELNQSLELETNLAHISVPDEEPLTLTLSELDDKFPGIPWYEYINNLMTYVVITKNERIVVRSPEYIKSLSLLLSKTPRRVQANYIMWRTVAALIPYLSEEFRERGFAFESILSDSLEKLTRWQECVQEVNNRLPLLMSALYMQNYFSNVSKDHALTLFHSIRNDFFQNRPTLRWLDGTTTDSVIKKTSKINNLIAYSDKLLDVNKLEQMYDKLEINTDEYLQSYLNIRLIDHETSVRSLREPVTTEDWSNVKTVAEIDTLYDPLENSISLPAGALQGVLFNKDHPNYLNYGGIGFIIARELTYAFLDIKRQTHEDNNYVDSDEVDYEETHLERFQCLIRQYSSFNIPQIDEMVNGTLAITEIIADNVGLKIAYLAYQKWIETHGLEKRLAALKYTPNQLFWISFAINQCSKEKPDYMKSLVYDYGDIPAEFKVIGAVANLEGFSNDFKCSIKAPMNPSERCNIG